MFRAIGFATAMSLLAGWGSDATAGKKDKKAAPPATGTLTAGAVIRDGPKFVLVSLYRDGELVRSRELENFRDWGIPSGLLGASSEPPGWKVVWKDLPVGTYEVRFEARGFAVGVKRVRVSGEDGDALIVHAELGEKPYRLGDQPDPRDAPGRRSGPANATHVRRREGVADGR